MLGAVDGDMALMDAAVLLTGALGPKRTLLINTGTALPHTPRDTCIAFLKPETLPLFALGQPMLNKKPLRTRT